MSPKEIKARASRIRESWTSEARALRANAGRQRRHELMKWLDLAERNSTTPSLAAYAS